MTTREVTQCKDTISIPRENFLNFVVFNEGLTHDDLRVLLLLMTELTSWNPDKRLARLSAEDPYIFNTVDIEGIAKALHLKKKEVRESLTRLEELNLLDQGAGRTAVKGYRLTF